ncbi:MAG: methyltransferase, partial [Paenibacillus sp.]|nr:methyltransferase [Paenibacillus sp.]
MNKPQKPSNTRKSTKAAQSGGPGSSSRATKPNATREHNKNAGFQQNHKKNPGPAGSAEDVMTGDRIVVTIKRIGINGEGVGYYKRKAVFINGVLPDEVIKAEVIKAEPTYLTAKLIEIEKKSPDRQTPPCPVYDACGGCQLQHMTYPSQLRAKEELIREAFTRYAKLDKPPLRPILGMEDPWGYRNKAQLQVGWHNEHIITGLYSTGTHKVVDISGCPVQHP